MNASRHERHAGVDNTQGIGSCARADWARRVVSSIGSRHAMILEPAPAEEGADAPIGASRLGGTPDLPAELPWPWRPALPHRTVFEDHLARPWPLSFVAQIDFAEILSAGDWKDSHHRVGYFSFATRSK